MRKDVAKEHRLKPVLVCTLTKKAKKDPKYLKQLLTLRDEAADKRMEVTAAIDEMNRYNVVIDSVASV